MSHAENCADSLKIAFHVIVSNGIAIHIYKMFRCYNWNEKNSIDKKPPMTKPN